MTLGIFGGGRCGRTLGLVFLALLTAGPSLAQTYVAEPAYSLAGIGRVTHVQWMPEGAPLEGPVAASQNGEVWLLGQSGPEVLLLDITDRMAQTHREGGIFSIAFAPDFATSGHLFVKYLTGEDPLITRVARYTADLDAEEPFPIDPATELVILDAPQPLWNHNGGLAIFGPDGYLYVGLGDGACCGDPEEQAQDPSTLLGSLLRLDVSESTSEEPYAIPPDNPFVDAEGVRPETYAYGLRSPWRFSFDRATDDLWLGDVGQDEWEEVNVVEAGDNLGWPVTEGTHCYQPPSGCDATGFTMPVWEYRHSTETNSGRASVTGGYVYRGTAMPDLVGAYVFADFVSGRIRALHADPETGELQETILLDTDAYLVSFAQDPDGELYILDFFDDSLFRLRRSGVATDAPPEEAPALRLLGANPFSTSTRIEVAPARDARLSLYDALGRRLRVLLDEPVVPASRQVTLDGTDLASGLYVLVLEHAGHRSTLPLVRLR